MDQDAFRKLLASNNAKASTTGPRGSFLPSKTNVVQKAAQTQTQKAGFKPRHLIKKGAADYRDRAAERREGAAGDFAEVEAVLESFQKHHADDVDSIEEKRKYLGGDAEHTVLVKGLDFALLEQQRMKVAAETAGADDDALEAAFLGIDEPAAETPKNKEEPKKRTREEIVQALKNKRSRTGSPEPKPVGMPLDSGKFKPLGFKPIGKPAKDSKKKKKKSMPEMTVKADGKETAMRMDGVERMPDVSKAGPSSPPANAKANSEPEPEPEPIDDIFAGVGEYEGIDFDEEDGNDGQQPREDADGMGELSSENTKPRRKWFDDDPDPEPIAPEIPAILRIEPEGKTRDGAQPEANARPDEQNDEEDEGRPLRLAPLAASTSIKDILAADSALEAEERKKARKEKKKGLKPEGGEKKKVSTEAKINRDYQKLQSYQAKKKAS